MRGRKIAGGRHCVTGYGGAAVLRPDQAIRGSVERTRPGQPWGDTWRRTARVSKAVSDPVGQRPATAHKRRCRPTRKKCFHPRLCPAMWNDGHDKTSGKSRIHIEALGDPSGEPPCNRGRGQVGTNHHALIPTQRRLTGTATPVRMMRAFAHAFHLRQGSSPQGRNGNAGSSAADEPGPKGDAQPLLSAHPVMGRYW